MEKISVREWKHLDEFVQLCFEPFGSMTKNDYEVELMHLLLENGNEEKSDHYLSTRLRMPISKVKRLRYEVDLRYPKDDENYYKDAFYRIVKDSSFKTDNSGNILFSVNNKALREFLSDKLEQSGSFFDSSFVSNIIRVTPADFLILIADFEKKDTLVKRVKESIAQNNKDLPKDLTEEGLELIESLFKDATSHIAPHLTKYFLNKIKK